MSTLFAMSQIALFGRDPGATPEDLTAATLDPTVVPSTESSAVVGWPMSEPSAPPAAQPARWRINSGDLEEMMLRAAAGLGLDRSSRSTAAHLEDGSPPLSRDDLVEERDSVSAFAPSSTSRDSSPLYRKHVISDYQEHNLDTTAPSSPCTPSMHMLNLSVVSPTSSRSEEAAFQQQHHNQHHHHNHVPLEADSRAAAPGPAARPGGAAAAAASSASSPGHGCSPVGTSGRFGLKLLVSNSMAGTLIGKGGTRICEIKDECLADIKVTPNGRFYPGTHERVVLVVGEPGSVQMACDRIVTTIYTAADTSLDITQRVLIPDAASGLIIGHDGVRLGDLRQEAGVASIQVSPRDMCTVAGERVVTLQGPMSAVILGLTLVVDRMMEDTTASRYQNMSTIYRAVHLHLPPYAVPGGGGMHDGSPRHPLPRLSPSYGGPSPHSQHDFHSPGAAAARGVGGGGRDYGAPGAGQRDFGYGGGGTPRELTPHGGGVVPATAMEYVHRSMSMPSVHAAAAAHERELCGSPGDHRSHTAPSAAHHQQQQQQQHFGGRQHHRQQQQGIVRAVEVGGPRDFDFGELDVRGRGGVGGDHLLEDCRREYDSPSPADIGGRPGSSGRDGYRHHSPRLPGPSPRDFDHMRQQQHGNDGSRGGFGCRGAFPPGTGGSQSDFLPQQQQQQRLRQQQQQQQQLSRPTAEYSQEATAGMLVHEARTGAVAAAAAAAAAGQQQQHRGLHDVVVGGGGGAPPSLHRSCSASMHNSSGSMSSPPPNGSGGVPTLRQCHSMVVGGPHGGGDASGGLAGMFDGMSLNSPHGLGPPPGSSSGTLLQQQQHHQAGVGGNGSCIVHGELPVPDADVGIILGKGGATVRELQQLSGAKIMIARRNEFMPGTKHRLVTLAGPPLAVNMARFLIMRKIQTEKEKL